MKLTVYKALWGMTEALRGQIAIIKATGYDGIESATQECSDPKVLKMQLKDHDLSYIALVYTEGSDHVEDLRRLVGNAMEFNPKKIVAHVGRDIMSFSEQVHFMTEALKIESEFGTTIAHETHRRRPFFSPMNTLALLKELPTLNVNIDYSHWCCVTETMLEDHAEAIKASAKNAVHLHGRIGYENGPQVPDPRVPEWERCVLKHEEWWDLIIKEHMSRGAEEFTFTPEYGPPSYMHTIPGTGKPVADLWDVCLWGAERFRKQFERAQA